MRHSLLVILTKPFVLRTERERGLPLKTLALETIHGGQFTLTILLTRPNYPIHTKFEENLWEFASREMETV